MNVNQTREYYMETEAQDLRKEGLGYLGMTERCIEKAKFTPEIVYDFFLMGAEKCLVSVLLDHGEMPIHHTPRGFDGLCEGLGARTGKNENGPFGHRVQKRHLLHHQRANRKHR
jgi:hypothetical protein